MSELDEAVTQEVTYGVPECVKLPPPEQIKPTVTAAQAKVEAIADLTHSAYQKAGTLNLTKEESEQLQADFPDEAFKPGAAGKESLIYIEHAFLRDRFAKVFGMGQWCIITRRTWNEKFELPPNRDRNEPVEVIKVYVEAMLVVRGCFVGEAIGDMDYFPKNMSQNYGDAVEGAKTAAFRRCAKEFGIGLQAWKKDWCAGWWGRKNAPHTTAAKGQPRPLQANTPVQPKAAPKLPTAETRKWMIRELKAAPGEPNAKIVNEYFIKVGQLLPNETTEELPLRFVPFSKGELDALVNCLSNFEAGGDAVRAFDPHGEAEEPKKKPVEVPREDVDNPEEEEPWRKFPMPWGKQAGVAMEDLEKAYLYGLWLNYKVEVEYNGKPKKAETIEKDIQFRLMLDMAGQHYNFQKKD
jgi:hypothetical protein